MVSCELKNTGDMYGADVIQCYVGDVECSVDRPIVYVGDSLDNCEAAGYITV